MDAEDGLVLREWIQRQKPGVWPGARAKCWNKNLPILYQTWNYPVRFFTPFHRENGRCFRMLWIRRTTMFTMFGYGRWLRWVGWEYKEEVTTTWPGQKHGRPNELKLRTWNTRLLHNPFVMASKDGLSCRGREARADEESGTQSQVEKLRTCKSKILGRTYRNQTSRLWIMTVDMIGRRNERLGSDGLSVGRYNHLTMALAMPDIASHNDPSAKTLRRPFPYVNYPKCVPVSSSLFGSILSPLVGPQMG